MDGWGSRVMENCMENDDFRTTIIKKHNEKMGYYAKDFFEKKDPFNDIQSNSNLQNLVICKMCSMYTWNVQHVHM